MSKPFSPPREVLAAHHHGLATPEEVVRSLIAYDNWVVPVFWMSWWRTTFANIALFGNETELPPDELWLFTDLDAAELAAATGAHLGCYATGPTGREVFRRLNDRWSWHVRVNPCSPAEATWSLGKSDAHWATIWSDTFDLEELLAQRPNPDPKAKLHQILGFRWYVVLMRKSDGAIVTLTYDRPNEIIAIFTASDKVRALLDHLYPTAQDRDQFDTRMVSGMELFASIREDNFRGKVAINPNAVGAEFVIDLANFG
jgi:hypothetical protein